MSEHKVVDLISTTEAARLCGVDPRTLRSYTTPDGRWCILFGYRNRFRVFNYGGGLRAQRRYDRSEILRILDRLERAN
jgi:hypothetical protein